MNILFGIFSGRIKFQYFCCFTVCKKHKIALGGAGALGASWKACPFLESRLQKLRKCVKMLILCNDNSGAHTLRGTINKVFELGHILIVHTDAAFAGHGANGSRIMIAIDTDTNPACIKGNKPRAISTGNLALAITKIMGPKAGITNFLHHEGHLS